MTEQGHSTHVVVPANGHAASAPQQLFARSVEEATALARRRAEETGQEWIVAVLVERFR